MEDFSMKILTERRQGKFVCSFCGKGGLISTSCCFKKWKSQEAPYQIQKIIGILIVSIMIILFFS